VTGVARGLLVGKLGTRVWMCLLGLQTAQVSEFHFQFQVSSVYHRCLVSREQ